MRALPIVVAVVCGVLLFRTAIAFFEGLAMITLLTTIMCPSMNVMIHHAFWRAVALCTSAQTREIVSSAVVVAAYLGEDAWDSARRYAKQFRLAFFLCPTVQGCTDDAAAVDVDGRQDAVAPAAA